MARTVYGPERPLVAEVRRDKWSDEEIAYATMVITLFVAGTLRCLRASVWTELADRLNRSRSAVKDKLGSKGLRILIGRRVFKKTRAPNTAETRALEDARLAFRAAVEAEEPRPVSHATAYARLTKAKSLPDDDAE